MLLQWINDIGQFDRYWFTSDQHFGHHRIIEFCERPFDSVSDMDDCLIEAWNENVGPDDVVFHLGDFTLGNNRDAQRYFRQLNGKIYVLANPWHHDRYWMGIGSGFGHTLPMLVHGERGLLFSKSGYNVHLLPPMVVLEVNAEPVVTRGYPLAITLCHYPMEVWDRHHYGAIHLHGHNHLQWHVKSGRMPVSVDLVHTAPRAKKYAPVNLTRVLDNIPSSLDILREWQSKWVEHREAKDGREKTH